LRAGLLYGLAYLAESVALPVSIGLIIILHCLHTSAATLSVEGLAASDRQSASIDDRREFGREYLCSKPFIPRRGLITRDINVCA
jgi:hypothetical protein